MHEQHCERPVSAAQGAAGSSSGQLVGQLLDLLAQPLPHAVLPSNLTRGATDALCFDMDSLMPSLPADVVGEIAAAAAPPPPPPSSGGGPRRRVPQVLRAHSVAVCRVHGLSYGDEGAAGGAGAGKRPGEPTSAAGPASSYGGAGGGGGGSAKPVGSDVHSTGTAAAAVAAGPGATGRSNSYSSGGWLAVNGGRSGLVRLGGGKGTKRPGRRPVDGPAAAAAGMDLMVGGGADEGTDSDEGEEAGSEGAAAEAPEVKRQRVEVAAACAEAEVQLGGVVAVRLVEGAVVSAGGVGPDAWLAEVSVAIRAPGEGKTRRGVTRGFLPPR